MLKKFYMVVLMVTIAVYGFAETVKVGSKIDTEGALLGNMIYYVLKDAGVPVENKTELGPTNIVRRAITKGQIDIYPEYTGNGAYFFKGANESAYKDWQKGYDNVKMLDYKHNKIVWLKPSPANNTWAIAVRKDFAKKHGMKTLEDMADYINAGNPVMMAGSEEFTARPDALPAFKEAYGFDVSDDQLIILSGGNTTQTEQALARKTNGVNFAMAYGTDGGISALSLMVLEDTKGVQPVYAPAPIVRAEILKKYPQIKERLEALFEKLDMDTLQSLNAMIAVNGVPAVKTAKQYLQHKGFIK